MRKKLAKEGLREEAIGLEMKVDDMQAAVDAVVLRLAKVEKQNEVHTASIGRVERYLSEDRCEWKAEIKEITAQLDNKNKWWKLW